MRAETPDKAFKVVYKDILEGPLLTDYLKAQQFFKDEMDEDPAADEYTRELKTANEQVSPLAWDSNTVVLDVFRVLQDLTPYVYDFKEQGNLETLVDINPTNLISLNAMDDLKPMNDGSLATPEINLPIGLKDSKLVNGNLIGTL